MNDFKPGGLIAVDTTGLSARKRGLVAGRTFRIVKVNPKMLITKAVDNGEDMVVPKERALNRSAGTLVETPAPQAKASVTEVTLPSYADLMREIDEEKDLFTKFGLGVMVRHIGPKSAKWDYADGAIFFCFKVDTHKKIVNIALAGGDNNKYLRVSASNLEVVKR